MRPVFLRHTIFYSLARSLPWLFLLSLGSAHCQKDLAPPEPLAERLHRASQEYPAEEVYLQTSKGTYETGEDLWFKGYVLLSQELAPSALSGTLYVQLLLMPGKEPVWEEKYAIENGFVDGHLYIGGSLSSGEYMLVAHTPRSIGGGRGAIRSARKVEIIKSILELKDGGTTPDAPSPVPLGLDFQLMPEGGHLVSGMQNRVAFRAVGRGGAASGRCRYAI